MAKIYVDSDDKRSFGTIKDQIIRFYKKDNRVYDLMLSLLSHPVDLIKIIYEYSLIQIDSVVTDIFVVNKRVINVVLNIDQMCELSLIHYSSNDHYVSCIAVNNSVVSTDIGLEEDLGLEEDFPDMIDFFNYYMFKTYGKVNYCNINIKTNVKCSDYTIINHNNAPTFNFSMRYNIISTIIDDEYDDYYNNALISRTIKDGKKLKEIIIIVRIIIKLFKKLCKKKIEPS